jgi:hypothetical protein
MPTKSANLNVVSIDHYCQEFGNSQFLTVKARTADSNEDITVSIEYDALRKNGVDPLLATYFVGSTIMVKPQINNTTKVTVPALDRINGILDQTSINPKTGKPISLLLVNQMNCSLLQSELYADMVLKMASATQAAMLTEEKKERRIETQKRSALRNSQERPTAQPKVAEPTEKEPDAQLEENENPF